MKYTFTVSWTTEEGKYKVKEVEADHPGEVWGKIWPNQTPPESAKIVDVEEDD
jgi:hypothetical protein